MVAMVADKELLFVRTLLLGCNCLIIPRYGKKKAPKNIKSSKLITSMK